MVTSASLHTSFQFGVPSPESPWVLLVEDEVSVQHLERVILEEHGYQVRVANNGEEALDALRETAPDLILLDVELGGIDGFTTCQRIRQISDVPILMVTSKDSTGDKIWGLEVGADDYLTKPFHSDELAARVKVNLRRPKLGNGETEVTLPNTLPILPEKLPTCPSGEIQEESPEPQQADDAIEGLVYLEVKGAVRQMLSFSEGLRQDERFRVLKLISTPTKGTEIQLSLREPVPLQEFLLAMPMVEQVSIRETDELRYSVDLSYKVDPISWTGLGLN